MIARSLYFLLLLSCSSAFAAESNDCEERLFNLFKEYRNTVNKTVGFGETSKYWDLATIERENREHLKNTNITGLLFVTDEEIKTKMRDTMLSLNKTIRRIVGVHAYTGFCKGNIGELYIDGVGINAQVSRHSFEFSYSNNRWLFKSFQLVDYSSIKGKYSIEFNEEFKKIDLPLVSKTISGCLYLVNVSSTSDKESAIDKCYEENS